MLNDSNLSNIFWTQDIHTIVHILNIGKQIRVDINMSPYELWKGKQQHLNTLEYLGEKWYIKRNDEN